MPLKIEHHIVLDSSPALCKLIDAITGASKDDENKILVELTNKLKTAKEKLIASFGENIKKSQ